MQIKPTIAPAVTKAATPSSPTRETVVPKTVDSDFAPLKKSTVLGVATKQPTTTELAKSVRETKAAAVSALVKGVLDKLPQGEGTRVLREAFQRDDLTNPERATVWARVANRLFVDENKGAQVSDVAGTSRREAQDLQAFIAVNVVNGALDKVRGLDMLDETLTMAKGISDSHDVDARHALLWGEGEEGGIAAQNDTRYLGLRGMQRQLTDLVAHAQPAVPAGKSVADADTAMRNGKVDFNAVSPQRLTEALAAFDTLALPEGISSAQFLGPSKSGDGTFQGIVDGVQGAYSLVDGKFIKAAEVAATTEVKAIETTPTQAAGPAMTWDGKSFEDYSANLIKLDKPRIDSPHYTAEENARFREIFSYGQPNAAQMHRDDWTEYWKKQVGAGPSSDADLYMATKGRGGSTAEIAKWKQDSPNEYAWQKMGAKERSDFKARTVTVEFEASRVGVKKDGLDYERTRAAGTAKLSLLKDKGINLVGNQIASVVHSCDPSRGDTGALQSSQLRLGNDVIEFNKTPLKLHGDTRFDLPGRDTSLIDEVGVDAVMRNTELYTDEQKAAQLKGNSLPYRVATSREPSVTLNGNTLVLKPGQSVTLEDGTKVTRKGAAAADYWKTNSGLEAPSYEIETAKYKMNVGFYVARMDGNTSTDVDAYGVATALRDEYLCQKFTVENKKPADFGGSVPTGVIGDIITSQNCYSLEHGLAMEKGYGERLAYDDLSRYTTREQVPDFTGLASRD